MVARGRTDAALTPDAGSSNKTWGTLAGVVVMLIWLWLTSAALLFGAELNAEAQRGRNGHRQGMRGDGDP
jgi:membrane protein